MIDNNKGLEVFVLIANYVRSRYSGLYLRLEMISSMKCECSLVQAFLTKPECFRDSLLRFCDGNRACTEHVIRDFVRSALSRLEDKAAIRLDAGDPDVLAKTFMEDPKGFLTTLLKIIDS